MMINNHAMNKVDINLLLENPENPRTITDAKFEQLVKSIKNFPQMLELRPLVVDKDFRVLGGNMRLRACKAAGMNQVPVIQASDLTEAQQREFIIKDNVGFGEWEWEAIVADWPEAPEWGLDIPEWSKGMDENNMTDEDIDTQEEFDPIGTMDGKQRVVFLFVIF